MKKELKETLIIVLIFALFTLSMASLSYNFGAYPFMEYRAIYVEELDLNVIGTHLNNTGISFSMYTETGRNNKSWNAIEFSFGVSFNNSSRNDTLCTIYQTSPYFCDCHVNLRLYSVTKNRKNLEQLKPAIEDSMDFITDIIHNATGKYPTQTYYFYEDGPALEYPSNYNYLTVRKLGEQNDP